MAVNITTAYSGEVLNNILARMIVGNELVDGGHVKVQNGIRKAFSIPRIGLSAPVIQPRVATPVSSTSQGDYDLDEVKLEPNDMMAYVEFNPRSFEDFWRPWQPSGELVFRELPAEVQTKMLQELARRSQNEIALKIVSGDKALLTSNPLHYFDGFLTRAAGSGDTIVIPTPVALTAANVESKLDAVYKALPIAVRRDPLTKMMISVTTMDLYEEAQYAKANKGPNVTDNLQYRYRGKQLVPVAEFPDDTIYAAKATNNENSNLWIGVDHEGDETEVKVERLQANSELFFFKMNMKMDTQVVFHEETVLYKATA